MLFIIILIAISLISVGSFAFINLGKWLLVSDPLPEKLDVIFVFGGTLSRARYALRLKDKYPDVRIIINNSKNRINKNLDIANILAKEGFNTDNVLSIGIDTIRFLNAERNVKSGTYLEVIFLIQWMQNYLTGKKASNRIGDSPTDIIKNVSVGLVSDGFHMRRIKLLVERKMKKLQCKFWYLPSNIDKNKHTGDSYTYWWKYKKIRKVVLRETFKFVYTIFFINGKA